MIRRGTAEFVGTAFLVAAVVGSGIAAQRLSPGDVGLQLLENAFATAAALVAIILVLGPVSGAHLNPVITLVDLTLGGLRVTQAAVYLGTQVAGGVIGAISANLMYGLAPVAASSHERGGAGVLLSEVVATFGLVLVVFGLLRSGRRTAVPLAVGAYIGAAYFFSSSTSFANPAVTVARTLTDTFAGIAPASAPAFILAQLIGGAAGLALTRFLYPRVAATAEAVVVRHR